MDNSGLSWPISAWANLKRLGVGQKFVTPGEFIHERPLFPAAFRGTYWRSELRQGHRDLQVRENQV